MNRSLLALFTATISVLAGSSCQAEGPSGPWLEFDSLCRIAEADADWRLADAELARWKFRQLQRLREGGNATWQELAQQEVLVRSAIAMADASNQFAQTLGDWQSRIHRSSPHEPDAESIGLYLPDCVRMVGWIGIEHASAALLQRHIEELRVRRQAIIQLDQQALDEAVEAARVAVEFYANRADDIHRLHHAEIRLRLAEARNRTAKARRASLPILDRRIARTRQCLDAARSKEDQPSLELVRPGTWLVDATSDPQMIRLVTTMTGDSRPALARLAWLQQHMDAASDSAAALGALSHESVADELARVHQLQTAIDSRIRRTREVSNVHQRIARRYESIPNSNSAVEDHSSLQSFDEYPWTRADVIRHWIELEKHKLDLKANLLAIEAEREYLAERSRRLGQLPPHARPPRELDHLRRCLGERDRLLEINTAHLSQLDHERRRFCRQVELQRGRCALVQVDGALIHLEAFEAAQAAIAAIGFVGLPDLFRGTPRPFPYVESAALIDELSHLSTRHRGPDAVDHAGFARDHYAFARLKTKTTIWESPDKWTRGRDRIGLQCDSFLYVPYGWQRVHPHDRWQTRDYYWRASAVDDRHCGPDARWSERNRCAPGCRDCTFLQRQRFPVRECHLFQSAFPARSLLYTNPNARVRTAYKGYSPYWQHDW